MACSGNSICLKFHNCLGDSVNTTFDKLRNATLTRWQYTTDKKGDVWACYNEWSIRLIIQNDQVISVNILTKNQIEEGDKEYVKSVLENYLSDLQENNHGTFLFEIADIGLIS